MQILSNEKLLQHYLQKYNIPAHFETRNLSFVLCGYRKGELINARRDSASSLQYLVKGRIQIYNLLEDGRKTPLCLLEAGVLLGDLEFCGSVDLTFLVEAASDVLCVELPLQHLKQTLLEDNRFLRTVLSSLAGKLTAFARVETQYPTLTEKLLDYLRNERPDHCLRGVEAAAVQLRCSRRQLQRVLRAMTEQNVIEKTGKGCYRLPI